MTAKGKIFMKKINPQAQSLIEYVITITAVLILIVGGTIGFHRGVQNSVTTFQRAVGATVTSETPFNPHSDRIKDPKAVTSANPQASYSEFINKQDTDTGGPPQDPNI
jgi:hypothetical protein